MNELVRWFRARGLLARLGSVFTLVVLAAAAAVVLDLVLFPATFSLPAPPLPSGPEGGNLGTADPGWALRALDGREVRLGDFAGKVVFLNLWATWCGPCVAEMPGILSLYRQLKDEGVVFLLVTEEAAEPVQRFVQAKGWQAPVYLAGGRVPAVFATAGIPATFILNPRGEVVFRHVGAAQWDRDDCRRFLRRLR